MSRINEYLAGCRLDWGPPRSWSLATPFPPTLAPHLLDQVNFEKNCLANGTRSHPHGFPPFTVIAASPVRRRGPRIVGAPRPRSCAGNRAPFGTLRRNCARGPWAASGFAEHVAPCLRSSTARSYQNKNAGLVGPADSCSSPCGKRLGSESEVPADPLISIGGRSHYQREVLQLPLQHGDRAD